MRDPRSLDIYTALRNHKNVLRAQVTNLIFSHTTSSFHLHVFSIRIHACNLNVMLVYVVDCLVL